MESDVKKIELIDSKECSGCFSCLQKCPQNAIVSYENEEGFKCPKIDKSKCINCGICLKVCPQTKMDKENEKKYPQAFAMFNKNENELKESSSGGIFSVLAKYVIENHGTIYGAAYDNNLKVVHIRITRVEELYKLRGSKYVQSDINSSYIKVEQDLKTGKMVLFTGTPCQVAGLKSFLMKEYKNLYTCDLVCHGVPSPKLFKVYLEYLRSKFKSRVVAYNFRTKEKNGWGSYEAKVITEDKKNRIMDARLDPYYSNFLKGNTYRENCYKCKYANCNREADITLADYWGIKKIHPEFFSKAGRSLVLINNKQGEELIDKVKCDLNLISTDLNIVIDNNENLKRPTKRPEIRNYIYKGINNVESSKYIKNNLKVEYNIKIFIKVFMPVKLKNKLKKILNK